MPKREGEFCTPVGLVVQADDIVRLRTQLGEESLIK